MLDPQLIAILMLCTFFLLLMVGVPVAVSLGFSGIVFGYLGFGGSLFFLLPARIYGVLSNYTLLAIPLFVFMGIMLEKSRLSERLIEALGKVVGPFPGGLGIAIVAFGLLMGASTGIAGATVSTLGLLALPPMLRMGYNAPISCGVICASGTLGQIIPPSLILILLSDVMGVSVGTLFAAALLPGVVLAGIYSLFFVGLGLFRRDLAPRSQGIFHDGKPDGREIYQLVKEIFLPIGLIMLVLGSIIAGIAAPTEAASIGALGSLVIVAASSRLTLQILREAMQSTLRITAMVYFILLSAQIFALTFRGLNGDEMVEQLFNTLPGGDAYIVLYLLAFIFILGFFLEWIEICYIAVPLFLPILAKADVNITWIAILIALNLQTSYLTPPFGWSLFFLKGVAPSSVSTMQIYRGVAPFVLLQLVALAILYHQPNLATWLPRAIGW